MKHVKLCKPVKGGMTEQEKAEAGFLYNPNSTTEMAKFRFTVQDAICEYNKLKPSQVKKRRDFLAKIPRQLLDGSVFVLLHTILESIHHLESGIHTHIGFD